MEKEIQTNSLRAWLLASRPKTLAGAAVPVAIGLSLAWSDSSLYEPGTFSPVAAVLCLLFALIMQVDANFVNDFFDYVRGNDDSSTRLGPLRACTQGWVTPGAMKQAIATVTVLACLAGLPLIVYGGLEMIIVGVLCVLFCFLYTTHLSYIAMGDLLVLVFFGIVPVCITYYVQLHTIPVTVIAASIACGLVVDALLVVNNYRDRDIDRCDGKRTLVVLLGARYSEHLYLLLGIAACLFCLVFAIYDKTVAAVTPLLYLVFHVYTWIKLKRINHGRQLNECLAETARNIIIFGLCVSIGILIGST